MGNDTFKGMASNQKRKKRQYGAPEKMFLYPFKLFLLENLPHFSCKPNKSQKQCNAAVFKNFTLHLYFKLYTLL